MTDESYLIATNTAIVSAFWAVAQNGTFETDGNVESPPGWWAEFRISSASELMDIFENHLSLVPDIAKLLMDSRVTFPAALLLRVDSDGRKNLFSYKADEVHEGWVKSDALEQKVVDLTNEYLNWLLASDTPILECDQPILIGEPHQGTGADTCIEKFDDLQKLYNHLVEKHSENYMGDWQIRVGPREDMGGPTNG